MAIEESGNERHLVTIVGAGFGGLCMAIRLMQSGITDFVILEKAEEVGGTWYVNHYPGAACDIPSHLYSYSFEPWPDWSRTFASQGEIQRYILHCVDRYGLRPHIRFNTPATDCRFNSEKGEWTTVAADGRVFSSRFAVLGTGGLSIPAYPEIKGIEDFTGPRFHSAEWDYSISLEGKNVAVIGTGASAIQFVPQIAKVAGSLNLYQRTAPWVLPRPDRSYSSTEKWLFRHFTFTARLHRQAIYWRHEAQGLGFVFRPALLRVAERMGLRNIRKGIKDEALRKKVQPGFHIGCKRILMANDYYPTLARPNVEVITDAISYVTEKGVVDATGRLRAADVIIYGTGFRIADYLWPLKVYGTAGTDLRNHWADRPQAYLGISVHGYPNMFLIVGPNTGLGHNSMIVMIEAQVEHILATMQAMAKRNRSVVEVKADVQQAYSAEMQEKLAGTVWLTGCRSWYLSPDGSNNTLWPRLCHAYRQRTAGFHAWAYEMR